MNTGTNQSVTRQAGEKERTAECTTCEGRTSDSGEGGTIVSRETGALITGCITERTEGEGEEEKAAGYRKCYVAYGVRPSVDITMESDMSAKRLRRTAGADASWRWGTLDDASGVNDESLEAEAAERERGTSRPRSHYARSGTARVTR